VSEVVGGAALVVLGYLLGAIPFGLIVGRAAPPRIGPSTREED
jgi:glycerol-3-phosphate acyltransferase PlsY